MRPLAIGDGPALVILALAVWRLGSLITYERGPWHVFQGLREHLGRIAHDANGHPAANPATFWGELLTCQYCCTMWLGVLWALAYGLLGAAAIYLALPFALSAGALVLGKHLR
jgi:hypothetical protein